MNCSTENGRHAYPALSAQAQALAGAFGGEIGADRKVLERLNAALLDARNENRQLVQALRSLHSQFNAVQMHANKQSELLLGGGEELQETRQRLVALQRELDGAKKENAMLRNQRGAPNGAGQFGDHGDTEKNSTEPRATARAENIDPQKATAAQSERRLKEYRDALAGMGREINSWKAAAEKRERDNAKLARKIAALDERCAELDRCRAELKGSYEELLASFDDRNKEAERLNEHVRRMEKELGKLAYGMHQRKSAAKLQLAFTKCGEKISTKPANGADRPKSGSRQPAKPWWYGDEGNAAVRDSTGHQQPQDTSRQSSGNGSVEERFVLLSIQGKQTETHYPLNKKVMTIGRHRDSDIPVINGCVSRMHARIIQNDSRVFIEDAGSKHGLLINSSPKTCHELRHGDTFTIGNQEFELFDTRAGGHDKPPAPAA